MKVKHWTVAITIGVLALGTAAIAATLAPRHGLCVYRDIPFWRVKVDVAPLRDRVYMLSTSGTTLIAGNMAALAGEQGVLLVDAPHPEIANKIEGALTTFAANPRLRMIVGTHSHGDHTCAFPEFSRRGALTISHDNLKSRMTAPGEPAKPTAARDLPPLTYTDSLRFNFGGQRVEVLHPPHAHTNGDSVIIFHDANVIHTGDLLVRGSYPYIDEFDGGSIDGYIAAQEWLLTLVDDETLIIPGHGALSRRADLEATLAKVKEARGRVAELKAAGLDLQATLARHPLDYMDPEWGQTWLKAPFFTELVYKTLP